MPDKRVYIIGDGPAGSATALSLMQHLKLNEPASTAGVDVVQVCAPASRAIAVGETIPPAASDYLRQLGVSYVLDGVDHLECPGSMSQWGDSQPGHNDFFFTPVGKGFHLNRRVFNQQLLVAASQAGVTQLHNTKLSRVKTRQNGLSLALQAPGGSMLANADFVIDATGIQAGVARSLGVARNEYDSVISACVVIDLLALKSPPAAHTLVSATEQGWWYACRLPENKALISFCTDKETLKRVKLSNLQVWKNQFTGSGWFYQQCLTQFGFNLSQSSDVMLRAAPSAILSCVIGDHWLAVGDAASSYDSVTSAGITKSLQQGWHAGKAVSDCLMSGDRHELSAYQDTVFQEFNDYLRLHQTLYHSEQRFPTSAFWARRQRRQLAV